MITKETIGRSYAQIRKPQDFVPVDLSDCVPKDFFDNKKEAT